MNALEALVAEFGAPAVLAELRRTLRRLADRARFECSRTSFESLRAYLEARARLMDAQAEALEGIRLPEER